MFFHDHVNKAKDEGRLKCSTSCWDCLRAIGLTPPFTVRDKYKSCDRPPVTFDRTVDPDATGDPGGVPQPQARSKRPKPQSAEDKHHLREAVRNREAI